MPLRKIGAMYIERLCDMADLYNRIEALCKQQNVTITLMCSESGASRASLSDLKMGRKQSLSADTLSKIATYFNVSVDYLLGRTNDPVDYNNDGEALAEIPLSYVEACDGDMRRARAMMLAVDADAFSEKEKALVRKNERRTTDEDLKIALFGGDGEVTDEMWEEAQFAAQFIKERHKRKKKGND